MRFATVNITKERKRLLVSFVIGRHRNNTKKIQDMGLNPAPFSKEICEDILEGEPASFLYPWLSSGLTSGQVDKIYNAVQKEMKNREFYAHF